MAFGLTSKPTRCSRRPPQAVIELDGVAVGDAAPGSLTARLRDRFWAMMDEPSALIEKIKY
ncbi:hypothetical protein [Hansschlegelia plantiphila]|uniref:Uncharacterized protein n=1 Tax=Hansschlegelia plantiphila TaxID=374655 RepID=A0A9W6J1E6_9HYPH|nr:hypothetical protein [Hansschlegelia plantiphila]GLK69046.1 hypothetical protein GCM10008179_26840 [Hansschlegelia plantiphila]